MLKATLPGPGRLSFWWRKEGNATFSFFGNGDRMDTLDAVRTWTNGTHSFAETNAVEVQWRIERSLYGNVPQCATGWVDQVAWTPGSLVTLDRQDGFLDRATVLGIPGEALPAVWIPARAGYSFGGYYSGTNGTGTQYYAADGTGARTWDREGEATLYAKWVPDACALTLDRQGGTGGSAGATATYGETPPAVEVPARAGHDFAGYYSGTNGTGKQYYNAAGRGTRPWDIAGGATLYAHWLEKAAVDWVWYLQEGTALVAGATPARGRLEIPPALGGWPVAAIVPRAFENSPDLTEVVVPAGVTGIGNDAFASCGNLVSVTLPDGLESIGDWVFFQSGLSGSVSIPASVASIGFAAFDGCAGLTAIEVAPGNPAYASVDGVLFSGDRRTLLEFPGGKTGAYEIPRGVEEIGPRAFESCKGLSAVAIPGSVTNIGDYAFIGCRGVSSLVVPDGVEGIGNAAFAHCSGLARLEVPGSWKGTENVAKAQVPAGCEVVYREAGPVAVAVPRGWLEENAAAVLAANGGDFEKAAMAEAANGMAVWECYVAGLDPEEKGGAFRVAPLSFKNGKVVVEWVPDLNDGGKKRERVYRVYGKKGMEAGEDWKPLKDGEDWKAQGWQFFKVGVGMP